MKRVVVILVALFAFLTSSAQIEHSIILEQSSFRKVNTDALTGVNIDPIRLDSSRNPCARLKIFFHRMTREQMEQLEPIFPSGTIDYTKCKVAEGNTVLILEFTARPQVKFYLKHPTFGTSNEVTFDYEGDKEYQIEASLNQTYSIVVNSNVAGADVYLDGVFKGKTDATKSLTVKDVMIGNHRLKLVYGSVTAQQQIDVNSSKISFRQDLNVEVERFDVTFKVQPAEATITIDNGFELPISNGLFAIKLPKGRHSYVVKADKHHSQSCEFDVVDDSKELAVSLKVDGAMVSLTAPNNAEIWVNGQKKGEGNWSGLLYSGLYTFEARKDSHLSSTLSKKITSEQAEQSYILSAPTPILGSLNITSAPASAIVYLDGKLIGETPLKLDNIFVGNHIIKLSKSGYNDYIQTVTVVDSENISINAPLIEVSMFNVPLNQIFYVSTDGEIVQPNEPEAFNVKIVSNIYEDGKGVITFNDVVTEIKENAFRDCVRLKSISIPESVTSVGDTAFHSCDNLINVKIPDSVRYVGRFAFACSAELKSVTIGNNVTRIDDWAFYSCHKLSSVIIGENVHHIGDRAFDSCGSLTDVIIPNSVRYIGASAFWRCRKLKNVSFGNNVSSIGRSAFEGCQDLISVTIPNSVTTIGESAFADCSNLCAFYGKFASDDNRSLIINGCLNAFAPKDITEYVIPNGITAIGSSAFEYSLLTNVTLPNSVCDIGSYAFSSCKGLKEIKLPGKVTYIGCRAFCWNENLTKVYCESIMPPRLLYKEVFMGKEYLTIYVPASTVKEYKKDKYWKNAGKIVAM